MGTDSQPSRHRSAAASPSLAAPGISIGVGMGGFVDGIILHQILQWHHMLSTTERFGAENLANMQVNVMADGLFHVATWIFAAAGLVLLWRANRDGIRERTWRGLLGWVLVGWGVFNLVEGVIDHHILQVHRVRPEAANPLAWDIGFLILGALLVLVGWALQRRDKRTLREPRSRLGHG